MSTRFLLAQLVESRIRSILQDAEQLEQKLWGTETRAFAVITVSRLKDAHEVVGELTRVLSKLGEGETKQDDNLAEKKRGGA